jgi:hypothetical protein
MSETKSWQIVSQFETVFNGKELPSLGASRNPAWFYRSPFSMIVCILDKDTCEIKVVNEHDPDEGWSYVGSFSSWASTMANAIANLSAEHIEFQQRPGCREWLRLKIDLLFCTRQDPELKSQEKYALVDLHHIHSPPVAHSTYLLALRLKCVQMQMQLTCQLPQK